MTSAFRIVQTPFVKNAFDGEGARLNGGRWNSPGTLVIYTASSLSLATLELLVHLEDVAALFARYSVIPIRFEEKLVQRLEERTLPKAWRNREQLFRTREIGDSWIRSGSSAILEVPSAVTHREVNYLLNPVHPHFHRILIEPAFRFTPDPRLHRKRGKRA